MVTEQNKAIYRRFIQEVFNEGRVDLLHEVLSNSYVFHDAPPGTGKAVTMTGLTMVRIADGRLVESWVKNDVMGLMSQLGAGPPKTN